MHNREDSSKFPTKNNRFSWLESEKTSVRPDESRWECGQACGMRSGAVSTAPGTRVGLGHRGAFTPAELLGGTPWCGLWVKASSPRYDYEGKCFFLGAPQVMVTDLGPALPICPRMSLSVPGTRSSCSTAGSSEHHQVPCQGLHPAHLLQKLCCDAVCLSKIKKLTFKVTC